MKKYIKKILISIILVIISLTTIFYVKADSGWDSDYGGGSDWGGSSWDSSDSSGGSDWGGSSWDSSDSSGGSMSNAELISLLCFIAVIFVIAFISNYKNKKSGSLNNSSNILKNDNPYFDLSEEEYNRYFGMNKDKFKDKIAKHFIDVQDSWMNFDYENLRKLCTDELYNEYKVLLETLKLKNQQNIMSDFLFNDISIYNVEEVNGLIEVQVLLDIKFKDYVIDIKNNKVIRGNKNIYFNNTYELTFVSSKNNKVTNCPSCGSKVEVTSSNVCDYCKNTVVQISDELVLSKKKIISSNKTNN